jgi:WhiB family transcriptional regulator, redox-sensing transcriptional regulator
LMAQNAHRSAEWNWMFDAACRGMDADVFFPTADADPQPGKGVCASCPVRVACLAFALEHGERFGIWGGLDEKERARLTIEERETVLRTAAA